MNGLESVGANEGNQSPVSDRWKKTLPARTSIGKRAPVEPALQRLDLEGHPIVIDAIAAVDAGAAVPSGPIETEARPPVVLVTPAPSAEEREDERIQLVGAADVLHIGVQFITQAEVQRELPVNAPVVLEENAHSDYCPHREGQAGDRERRCAA